MTYILSNKLNTFLNLSIKRMESGLGSVLLLEGEPGGGKTAFAKEIAKKLNGSFYYYSGSPDKERDLLYEIDVQGVLSRQNAWIPAPAWQSFVDSQTGKSVLLIDEVDKTSRGFDAFLLRLLEDFSFRSPNGDTITANPNNLCVILTSNKRRELRPEVLRRCQRIVLELPNNKLLFDIVNQIVPNLKGGLVELLIKLSGLIKNSDNEQNSSPKEIALCCFDLQSLATFSNDTSMFKEVLVSYLCKGFKIDDLDKIISFNWGLALLNEAKK